MLDLYVTICDKNTEVEIFDLNVIGMRSNLRSNHKCDCPFIIVVNRYWIFENTAHHLHSISLKFEYDLNILHKTNKGKTLLID